MHAYIIELAAEEQLILMIATNRLILKDIWLRTITAVEHLDTSFMLLWVSLGGNQQQQATCCLKMGLLHECKFLLPQ